MYNNQTYIPLHLISALEMSRHLVLIPWLTVFETIRLFSISFFEKCLKRITQVRFWNETRKKLEINFNDFFFKARHNFQKEAYFTWSLGTVYKTTLGMFWEIFNPTLDQCFLFLLKCLHQSRNTLKSLSHYFFFYTNVIQSFNRKFRFKIFKKIHTSSVDWFW